MSAETVVKLERVLNELLDAEEEHTRLRAAELLITWEANS